MRIALGFQLVLGLLAADGARAQFVAAPPLEAVELREFMVPSPYRIGAKALAGKIRYRLRFDDATHWAWPETGEQRAQAEGELDVLTICRDCGRERAPTVEELEGYLAPNAWVQSDDAVLIGYARRARSGSVASRMDRLVTAVRARLTGPVDYEHYLGAREAYDARRGDCTEFALLLAALARARGIPARVVGGIAYGSRFAGAPHAFGPHMWVQAWTGERWESYDAGLADFDAGHIALRIGDGSPDSLRGTMQAIRHMSIVDAEGLLPAALR